MQRGTHLFSTALDLFFLDCEARRLTDQTLSFYRAKLSLFIRRCEAEGVNNIQDLTAHHIRRYLMHLHRRELSSQYQYDLARAIRAFLNYYVRDELLEKSPFTKVQMPRLEKKILEGFSPDEMRLILKNCITERDRALCLFLLDTGLLASELIALSVEDIDLKTGMVTVRLGKGRRAELPTLVSAAVNSSGDTSPSAAASKDTSRPLSRSGPANV